MLKNISIKAKIVLVTLCGLFLLAGILGVVSVSETKDALMQKSYGSLTAARDGKAEQVRNFFAERVGDINVLSSVHNVMALVNDFKSIKDKLKIDSTGEYPVNETIVKEATKNHEAFFQKYMSEYGYYDIFVISAETGHVMYSAAKESDYGANLKNGSLKNSGLGEVFYKTLQNKRPTFVDMKPYAPSADAPAMFLGSPIMMDGKMSAVLVLQISDSSINKIMQFRKGYGDSQEDYLVGSDYLMRSDSFLDPTNHSLKASFANPSKGKAKTVASENSHAGKTNTEIVMDYNNNPVLSAYGSVKIGQDLTWAILSEIDEAEVMMVPNEIRNDIAMISFILLIIIGLVVYLVINKGVITPLNNFQNGLLDFFKYLNKETDTVNLLNNDSNDEIGTMAKVVNVNIDKTKNLIEQDAALLENVQQMVDTVKSGILHKRIEKSTINESLEQLKNSFNDMLDGLSENICGDTNKIQAGIEEFQKLNFVHRIPNPTGKTSQGLNSLADIINEMLVENKSNGLTLENSSEILLANVDILNTNSNEAAAALEETAAALEEMTGNIISNTENVVKMSGFAKELTNSANEGESLANQTTTAMNDIDKQVTAINDAISVIDQISFQTNILSLNAAVEAATAGEAGKGFAVVAQEVRNLASRSAEAANEIKGLVENATKKANDGKTIAAKMIEGYTGLNDNISKTIELITDVELASKEQQTGIEQINDAVTSLDQQTQENASISNRTQDVATQTDTIAKLVVSSANEKEFVGKDSVKAKDMGDSSNSNTNTSKRAPVSRINKKPINKKEVFKSKDENKQWESF